RLFLETLEDRRLLASDLQITKADAPDPAVPGTILTYTIDVTNNGPDPATATIADTFPANFTGVTFTSTATNATGNTDTGTGDIADDVSIDAGGTITYTVTGTI